MCVWLDKWLREFPLTSTVSPLPNPILVTSGARFEMLLFRRFSFFRLVSHVTAEMSEMELSLRLRSARLFNPARGEMSEMELL